MNTKIVNMIIKNTVSVIKNNIQNKNLEEERQNKKYYFFRIFFKSKKAFIFKLLWMNKQQKRVECIVLKMVEDIKMNEWKRWDLMCWWNRRMRT